MTKYENQVGAAVTFCKATALNCINNLLVRLSPNYVREPHLKKHLNVDAEAQMKRQVIISVSAERETGATLWDSGAPAASPCPGPDLGWEWFFVTKPTIKHGDTVR